MKTIRLKVAVLVEIDPEQLLDGLRVRVRKTVLRRELVKLIRAHFDSQEWTAPGDQSALPDYQELQQMMIESDLAETTE